MNNTFKRAARLEKLPVYLFAQLDEAKKRLREKGVDIIDLGVGDPDIPTPSPIIEKLIEAAKKPENHRYPSYEGLVSFREQVSKWYRRRFGVKLDPEKEVITLIGSKEGIAHISLGLLDPGDIALVPEPAYPVYQAGAIFAGAKIHYLPLLEDKDFLPSLEDIDPEIASQAKLMWINYPNNPTAAVASIDFFKKVVSFARKFNIVLCHDLAYSELSFDGYKPPSLLEVEGAKEIGIEFHSLSKTFSMTGWRIGFAVGNKEIIATLKAVKTNVDSGVFQAVQEAGEKALAQAEKLTENIKRVYRERRDFFVEGLRKLGWKVSSPKATFYLWIKTPEEYNSIEFARILLEKCGIVVTPGVGFGPSGEGYIRIALTTGKKRLKEALDRIKKLNIKN